MAHIMMMMIVAVRAVIEAWNERRHGAQLSADTDTLWPQLHWEVLVLYKPGAQRCVKTIRNGVSHDGEVPSLGRAAP